MQPDPLGQLLTGLGIDAEAAPALIALPLIDVASRGGQAVSPRAASAVRLVAHQHLGQAELRLVETWLEAPPSAETLAMCPALLSALAGSEDGPPHAITEGRLRKILFEASRVADLASGMAERMRGEQLTEAALHRWTEAMGPIGPTAEDTLDEDWFEEDWDDDEMTNPGVMLSDLMVEDAPTQEPVEGVGDPIPSSPPREEYVEGQVWGVLHFGEHNDSVALQKDRMLVGRGAEADIVLPWDSQISRAHAALEREEGGCLLVDLNSMNGTFVGDSLIEQRLLLDGETFRLGNTQIRLELTPAGQAPEMPEPVEPASWTEAPDEAVEALCRQAAEAPGRPFEDLPAFQQILDTDRQFKAWAVVAAMEALVGTSSGIRVWGVVSAPEAAALEGLISRLLRSKLPFDEPMLHTVLSSVPAVPSLEHFSLRGVIRTVERYADENHLSNDLVTDLGHLQQWLERSEGKDARELHERIRRVIALSGDGPFPLAFDRWGRTIQLWYAQLPRQDRDNWAELAAHARRIGPRLRPSQTWRTVARMKVEEVGRLDFIRNLAHWLRELEPGPGLDPRNRDAIKGLILVGGALGGRKIATDIRDFAYRCYEVLPGHGPRSRVLGNACVVALADMEPTARDPALDFLVEHIDQPGVRSFIESCRPG